MRFISFKVFIFLALILGSVLSCERNTQKDFNDYIDRIEGFGPEIDTPEVPASQVADIRGMWLLHANLSAGIPLGLRVKISSDEEWPVDEMGELQTPFNLRADIWLETQNPMVDDPVVSSDPAPALQEDGTFELSADPLILDPEVLGAASSVYATVTLNAQVIDADHFCGSASGDVTQPLTLNLAGSTFFAQRDDMGTLTLDQLPSRCTITDEEAPKGGGDEGAIPPSGGAIQMATRPEAPDLSDISSTLHDLSGSWLMNVQLPIGVALPLWVTFAQTTNQEGGALLDGAIRRDTDALSSEPLITFSTPLSADGRLEIWLPDFRLDGATQVEGQLLLVGLTGQSTGAIDASLVGGSNNGGADGGVDGGIDGSVGGVDGGIDVVSENGQRLYLCGVAAGQVTVPLPLDLAGTTFYAIPWSPGQTLPVDLPVACP